MGCNRGFLRELLLSRVLSAAGGRSAVESYGREAAAPSLVGSSKVAKGFLQSPSLRVKMEPFSLRCDMLPLLHPKWRSPWRCYGLPWPDASSKCALG